MEKKTQLEQVTEFMVGSESIKLTPTIVRQYLVSGDAEKVTMQEVVMFMNLCKANKLNPWIGDVYCVKIGNSPASRVVSAQFYEKRADANPNYNGFVAGIIVLKPDGGIERREGALYLPEEKIAGGWAKVWRKDREHPTVVEVTLDEYVGKKANGEINSSWQKRPATMIRKVAKAQAHREAFPNDFSGLYIAEEQGLSESEADNLPQKPDVYVESEEPDPFVKKEEPEVSDFDLEAIEE